MNLRKRFHEEVRRLAPPVATRPQPLLTEADLSPLPESARRYLRFMGVLGKPRAWSVLASFLGRFKIKQSASWRPCEVWQYDTAAPVSRFFLMQMRFGGLPMIARDTYREGHGRMLGKLVDLVTVVDGSGPEFDIGELVTYLNDLVLIAPSMLLAPTVTWSAVDARSFDLSLTDHGHVVKARVFLDDVGAPVNFETTDRFFADPINPKHLTRARWSTPMEGFQEIEGHRVPTRGQAVWHLTEGDFPYADFALVPQSLAFNVRPSE